jgi:DNA polymerase III delta subunit
MANYSITKHLGKRGYLQFIYTKGVITTLTGENDVLRQEALTQMVSGFIAEHGDMAVERLDGEEADYARMHEAAQSLPFLVPRKLVVLRAPSANILSSLRPMWPKRTM